MSLLLKLEPLTNLYDLLHHWWERPRTQRRVALTIFIFYLAAMAGIELNRMQLLPPPLSTIIPTSHFHAINLAFTLILGIEIMSLILTLSCSLSRSLSKQLEILALILMRDAFKDLAYLPEPVNLAGDPWPILRIAVNGSTALAIFICLGVYMRIRKQHDYITFPEERMRYVISKKLMALALFVVFLGFGVRDAWLLLRYGKETPFFETIYSVLIFSDIALVLIAQRFMPTFHAVFRNSGFVIATLIMRLSLSTAWPWNNAASIFAALYVLALTWATGTFASERVKEKKIPRKAPGAPPASTFPRPDDAAALDAALGVQGEQPSPHAQKSASGHS